MTTETVDDLLEKPAATRGRIAKIGAVAAGAGLAIFALRRVRTRRAASRGMLGRAFDGVRGRAGRKRVRARGALLRAAARRAYEHPERIARGNSQTIRRRVLETAAVTATRTIANRLARAVFDAAVF